MNTFEAMIDSTFGPRMKTDNKLCTEIWSALANVSWYHPKIHEEASYSFRAAGGMIADIRGSGCYMDWYCSGPYASITDEIRRTFRKEGWIPDEYPSICDEPGCLADVTSGWPSDKGYRMTCYDHSRLKHEHD